MFRKILFSLLVLSLLVSPLSASGNRWTNKPPLGSSINWESPLSKGLVACFLMNEGGGLKVNDIAKGNNGTIVNGALWKPSLRGMGIDFDGIDDYVNIPYNATLDLTTNLTVGVWVKKDTTTNAYPRLVTRDLTRGYELFLHDSTNKVAFGNDVGYKYTNIEYLNNNWHHVVGIYTDTGNFSGIKIYVDGVEITDTSTAGTFTGFLSSATKGVKIGDGPGGESLNGLIDKACIYNRALSPSEIQQLYQDPYCFIKPPTIWSMFSTAVAAARRIWMFN